MQNGSGFKFIRCRSDPEAMGLFSAASLLNPTRDERRVTPHPDAPVEIQVMGRHSLDVFSARNVSHTGVGVYVPHGFAGCDLEEEVELVITFPGERPFLARGIIKHRTESEDEGHHFGLHFTTIAREHRTKIRDYVDLWTTS